MPRKTFFSFHYQEDVWRAWNVRNSWVVPKEKESEDSMMLAFSKHHRRKVTTF